MRLQPLAWVALLLSFFLPFTAFSQEEAKVELRQELGRAVVTVKSPTPIENYDLIKIEAPARLVIDLWGIKAPKEANIVNRPNGAISKIALAEFRDRGRLVIDFASEKVPAYALGKEEKELIISIESAGPLSPGVAKNRSEAPQEAILERTIGAEPRKEVAQVPAEVPPRLLPAEAGQAARVVVPTLPPPVVGPEGKVYTGHSISLDFQEADIRNVLRFIADATRLNLIAGEDVKGKVTVRLLNVPWDQALNTVLKLYGLDFERVDNALRVASAETLKKERDERVKEALDAEARRRDKEKKEKEEARREAQDEKKAALELEELQTRLVPLNYADAAEMAKLLEKLKSVRDDASITPATKTNSLLIRDTQKSLDAMMARIKELDTPTPQVLIEARIVQGDTRVTRDLGIQWGGRVSTRSGMFSLGGGRGVASAGTVGTAGAVLESPAFRMAPFGGDTATSMGSNVLLNFPAAIGGGPGGALEMTIGRISDVLQLDFRLSALEAANKIQTLSAPKVIALDNEEAVIRQGTKIPYQVQGSTGPTTIFLNADLGLKVKPTITPEKSILMKVEVTRDEPVDVGQAVPGIFKNRASTEILLQDGGTAVIGGILVSAETDSIEGVPGLMRIPVLGWLFKRKSTDVSNQELLVFITTRIVETGKPGERQERVGSR